MARTRAKRSDPGAGILIVDDHPVTREGLTILLSREPDLRVCGEADDIPGALRQVAATSPDLAIIDISLKGGNGIELVKRLHARFQGVKSLVWSMYPDALYARRAIQAGAAGYLNKEHAPAMIMTAIRHILAGGIYLGQTVTQSVLQEAAGASTVLADPVSGLSDRELEVFRLIGLGFDTQQTADEIHLSPKTVETYRARIRAKLGADSGADVLRQAIRWVLENG